jgi:NAD(P)-dependent dehydrogenase (short-subunit alcohol dehydrogenase family)
MSDVFRSRLLEGKSAFVTGGGSGINLSIADKFAEHGARVAILGRKQEKLDAAVKVLAARGVSAISFSADVREYEAVASALKQAHQQHGPIDVLVCGAAGNFPARALDMSANGFKAVVDIDLLGTFNTCRAAYEFLRRPGASIINISAVHGFTPYVAQIHVCAAKSGVDMLTRVLALEWGPEGIRINSIAPGPVDDTEGMRRLAPTPEHRQRVTKAVPLRRFATKEEIAELALFLSSPAAAYITGTVIPCDGGQSLAGHSLQ